MVTVVLQAQTDTNPLPLDPVALMLVTEEAGGMIAIN